MLEIYTDGSSHARSGLPGGWGFVVLWQGRKELSGAGSDPSTSNNRMELTAAIKGLEGAVEWLTHNPEHYGCDIHLISDSQYCLGIANGEYSPNVNLDLAKKLRMITKALKAKTVWVKGHSGNFWNETVDSLAKTAKESCGVS